MMLMLSFSDTQSGEARLLVGVAILALRECLCSLSSYLTNAVRGGKRFRRRHGGAVDRSDGVSKDPTGRQ